MKMKTKELGSEEAVVVLPQPVNRQILVKYPISQSSVEGIIKLSPKAKQDEVQSKLVKLFPDGTMKYQIVARAEDCNPIYEVGIFVSFTKSGTDRPHQFISEADYMLISEGDIGLIWSEEAIEYNMNTYKKEDDTRK